MPANSEDLWNEYRDREVYGDRWVAYGSSRPGKSRNNNEDNFVLRPLPNGCLMAAVADGLGGHRAGEVASALACETVFDAAKKRLSETSPEDVEANRDALAAIMLEAHERILTASREDPRYQGMATTLTAVMLDGASVAFSHVGDSRLYLLSESVCKQVTRDHVAKSRPQEADGECTHGDKGPVTHCLGDTTPAKKLHVETGQIQLRDGDAFLLCTDGVSDHLDRDQIQRYLSPEVSLVKQSHDLIEAALLAGAEDDMTVVLIRILAKNQTCKD